MKISKIIAISLSMASTSAMAFQAKDSNRAVMPVQQIRTMENSILKDDYSKYGFQLQTSSAVKCAMVPVSGCTCAFCTMLRGQI